MHKTKTRDSRDSLFLYSMQCGDVRHTRTSRDKRIRVSETCHSKPPKPKNPSKCTNENSRIRLGMKSVFLLGRHVKVPLTLAYISLCFEWWKRGLVFHVKAHQRLVPFRIGYYRQELAGRLAKRYRKKTRHGGRETFWPHRHRLTGFLDCEESCRFVFYCSDDRCISISTSTPACPT